MTADAPEFRSKPLTPVSPTPVHPPEPEKIPVLQNQIDPIFNMTSTHMDPSEGPVQPDVTAPANPAEPTASPEQDDSIPDESSFSDAYAEEQTEEVQPNKAAVRSEDAEGEDDDDYAMTFDSSEEEHSDNHEEKPTTVEQSTLSEPVSLSANGATQPSTDAHESVSEVQPSLANPPPPPPMEPDPVASVTSADPPTVVLAEEVPSETAKAEQDIAAGGIDIQQLLDNITANAGNNVPASANATIKSPSANASLPQAGTTLLAPPHASLPPRPQPLPQQPPRTTYPSQDDLQNYFAGASNFPQPQPASYGPPGVTPPVAAAGAPGTFAAGASGLPPPPSASFQPPPAISGANQAIPAQYPQVQRLASQDYPARSIEQPDDRDEADRPWGPAVQKLYDEFLADERHYVTEGTWDKFPPGSRLFIGNLPTEKVTKRDLFQVFYKYGRLAQISLKQAYGFVQFHDANACYTALDREQGQEVRGRKMHLEISKPQKNSRNAQNSAQARRSRSPDFSRGGNADRGRHNQGRGSDRQNARAAADRDEFGRTVRARDDYRPGRSPSPSRNYRGRDDYAPHGRDYYDGRDRRRSRSRSPYGRRDNGRYRDRSLSPRAREANADADLQIPRRNPRDVPDVQIILMQELDRGFVSWVEGEFRARGVKVETMFLSPRLPLDAVIRRQILEGVHAVSQLDMRSQNSSKIPLQVFDRQGGANNVRFDEYRDLDPRIGAELVIRAKQTQPQIPPAYAQPQYPSNQSYQPPAAAAPPAANPTANLAALVGQLDNNTLQRLLGSLNTLAPQQQAPQQAPNVPPTTNPSIDLANLLGGLKSQQPPTQVFPPQQPQPDPYAGLANNPALASLFNSAAAAPQQSPAQPQPQQSAQQVQNIMAQLAKFRQ